jgi:hypothetical protein
VNRPASDVSGRNKHASDALQISRENQFEYPMIGPLRESGAEAEFDVYPPGVPIENEKELMRLFRGRQEVADRTEVIVFFECEFHFLVHPHGDPRLGHKLEIRNSIPRVVHDRIEDEIEPTYVDTDDRANL